MKKLSCLRFAVVLVMLLMGCGAAGAEERAGIPETVDHGHWSCQAIEQLGAQYQCPIKFPAAVVGRRELATSLMTILSKVADHCEHGGTISDEDRQRLEALHAALHGELEQLSGYLERREAILRILAKPDEPQFLVKAGMGGFLRGEGAGDFRIADAVAAHGHGEGRFVYRVKPYLYWHPEDFLHLHFEGQGYGYRGSNQEFNKGSLYQGFAEVQLPGSDLLTLRGGRQEFVYGGAFILGSDSFNDGLTFDGGLVRLKPGGALAVDLLLGHYARPFSGNTQGYVTGIYSTMDLGGGSNLEAYWIRDTGIPDRVAGEYLSHAGVRGVWQEGRFTLEIEPVFALGRVRVGNGTERLEAFGGHIDAALGFDLWGMGSKLQAGYAFGNGSRAAASGGSTAGEFRNPNHDGSIVGDLGLIADLSGLTVTDPFGGEHHASGLHAISLGWGIDLAASVNFSITGRHFRADAVESGASRELGTESDLALTWVTCDYFSVIAGYDRFFSGAFYRQMVGTSRPVDYGYLMVNFDLGKSWPRKKLK